MDDSNPVSFDSFDTGFGLPELPAEVRTRHGRQMMISTFNSILDHRIRISRRLVFREHEITDICVSSRSFRRERGQNEQRWTMVLESWRKEVMTVAGRITSLNRP
jgi:hypothetical protein